MPFSPNKLARRRVTTSFEFNGEQTSAEYFPAELSEESMKTRNRLITRLNVVTKRLAETPDDKVDERAALEAEIEATTQEFTAWICTFFCGWEYYEDTEDGSQGPMVPITPERITLEMERYPDYVSTCVLAILHDYTEGNAKGAASSVRSGATFSRTEESITSMVGRSRKR